MPLADVSDVPAANCCERCSKLARNVRRFANLMGLRDWTVVVAHEPPLIEDAIATCDMPPERRECELRFAADFDEQDPEEQRYVLTHELVHPLLRDLYTMQEETAQDAYGGMAYRVHMQHVRRVKEQTVDAITAALAPHMPEVEW
jgi:hypothetical protein